MKVQLFISARKLKNMDTFSKSDPRCYAKSHTESYTTVKEQVNGKWIKRGKTESKSNTLNPDFDTHIEMDYYFERTQKLKFVMKDGDTNSSEKIGETETTLASIMGKKAQTFEGDLLQNNIVIHGKVIVRAEAVKQSN